MLHVIDKLKAKRVRGSTAANYLSIWRQFNKFVIRLDHKPKSWEERVAMFCAYLIDNGSQSTTVRSYVSAIKAILRDDGYEWSDNQILLSSLTRACKLVNDKVMCRLPIQSGLFELLLFEMQRKFGTQPYLESMFKAMFALAYYGMMRVGELTYSNHTLKAKNIHAGENKSKILMMLYSSKTHTRGNPPQKIKISALNDEKNFSVHRFFCPFTLVRHYITIRGNYDTDAENFFVFCDKTAVQPSQARRVLRDLLTDVNLDASLYNMHSFRIGRCCDLMKMSVPLDKIKEMGRWRTNIVYKYIK